MMMKLADLGSFTIEHQDNILTVDARGPFTQEIMEQFQQDMVIVSAKMKGQPWGSLVTYYGNAVFSPEAEEALIEITKYRVQHDMIANVTVILESTHADLQQMQLKRIYQTCNVVFHVFSDIEAAKAWLKTFLEQQRAAM